MLDGHGRRIGDLRVSVTDRCNFRCQYCMPAEGLPWLERAEILSFEEITRLVGVFAAMGVGDVRLTGGEPLVRRDFPRLAAMLARIDGVNEVSVTTNGFLLERDAERARRGRRRPLQRLGRLPAARPLLRAHTPRRAGPGPRGLRGARRLPGGAPDQDQRGRDPGVHRVEVLPFAELAASTPYQMRFIEFMPLDADRAWTPDQVLTGDEIRAAIHASTRWSPSPASPARPPASTASPTATAGSASSTRSPSRSAATATGSA